MHVTKLLQCLSCFINKALKKMDVCSGANPAVDTERVCIQPLRPGYALYLWIMTHRALLILWEVCRLAFVCRFIQMPSIDVILSNSSYSTEGGHGSVGSFKAARSPSRLPPGQGLLAHASSGLGPQPRLRLPWGWGRAGGSAQRLPPEGRWRPCSRGRPRGRGGSRRERPGSRLWGRERPAGGGSRLLEAVCWPTAPCSPWACGLVSLAVYLNLQHLWCSLCKSLHWKICPDKGKAGLVILWSDRTLGFFPFYV